MSNEQLIALATPPAVSDRFEIQGLSLSNALAHAVLGPSLGRMSEIVDRLRRHSLVLFNESFKSTNVREGSEIAGQIVAAQLRWHRAEPNSARPRQNASKN
jgi:hypothetical protein